MCCDARTSALTPHAIAFPKLCTPDAGFVVDALALQRRLRVLNRVLADPKIVKVREPCLFVVGCQVSTQGFALPGHEKGRAAVGLAATRLRSVRGELI